MATQALIPTNPRNPQNPSLHPAPPLHLSRILYKSASFSAKQSQFAQSQNHPKPLPGKALWKNIPPPAPAKQTQSNPISNAQTACPAYLACPACHPRDCHPFNCAPGRDSSQRRGLGQSVYDSGFAIYNCGRFNAIVNRCNDAQYVWILTI